uniref:Uncharacterized protein n=1 Tax=Timema cristinae TaxID=61476 RepID=A0A7R9CLA8_TIMCR|nr:unnamed protein product [Timema cristinae]
MLSYTFLNIDKGSRLTELTYSGQTLFKEVRSCRSLQVSSSSTCLQSAPVDLSKFLPLPRVSSSLLYPPCPPSALGIDQKYKIVKRMWGGGSSEGGEGGTPPANYTEVKDLEAHFEKQHSEVARMRELVALKDQQQAAKVKQVQEYATKLSQIKSRSKASKRSLNTDTPKTQTPIKVAENAQQEMVTNDTGREESFAKEIEPSQQMPASSKKVNKSQHGNLNLLRKKLEENRVKFEQRGKEMTENKKGIEEMVTQLKYQLDERDQIIRGLQSSKPQPVGALPESLPETTQATESQSSDLIQQNPLMEQIHMCQQQMQEMAEQMASKDNRILELNNNIVDLQNNIFDLHENLKEKDLVIDARTKAITLMSEDLSRKGKTTLDTLDETRHQMRIMQQNFVGLETKLKESQSSDLIQQNPLMEQIHMCQQQMQEMAEQMASKDNRILELNNNIVDLQNNIFDLHENLKEKDLVIDARTKAITLMSEDLSRKGKTTLDTLDETRHQMRIMQQNFVGLETKLKVEKEKLNKEIEEKDKRLEKERIPKRMDGDEVYRKKTAKKTSKEIGGVDNNKLAHFEEINRQLESTRFDLSTRNAELQEKVVHLQELTTRLQSRNSELELGLEEKATAGKGNVGQLTEQLDAANKQLIKVKAQHASKIKNLKKQLDSLKKVSDANEEITRLQNKVAELEEDKGNLQLHLVDFDELKDVQKHKEHVSSVEEQINELKASLSEVENLKVTLEIKAVQLEEQVDILSREKAELIEEVKTAKDQLNLIQQEKTVDLGEALDTPRDDETENKTENLVGKNEKDSNNLEVVLRGLESELIEAKRVTDEQKDIMSDLSFKLESKEEELEMQRDIICKLEQLSEVEKVGEEDGNRITEIVKDLNEMAEDLEEWKNRCAEVESRLRTLETEKTSLENRFEEVKNENKTLNSQLQEQKTFADTLTDKLKDQNDAILNRDEKISHLQDLIDKNGHLLEAREKALQELHVMLKTVQDDFNTRRLELENIVSIYENDIVQLKSNISKMESVLEEKRLEMVSMGEKLQNQGFECDKLQTNIQEMQLIIDENNNTIQRLQQEVNTLKNESASKTEYIEKLQVGLKDAQEVETQLEQTTSSLKNTSEELECLKQEVVTKNTELSVLTQKFNELEIKSSERTEKIKRLTASLKAKAIAVKAFEEKMKQYEFIVKDKETAIAELILQVESKNIVVEDTETLKTNLEERTASLNKLSELLEEQNQAYKTEQGKAQNLAEEVSKIKETIEHLENAQKIHAEEAKQSEESHVILIGKISHLEKEIGILQIELRNKGSEVELTKDEHARLEEECYIERQRSAELQAKITALMNTIEMLKTSRNKDEHRVAELEDEVLSKDVDYIQALVHAEGLQNVLTETEVQLDKSIGSNNRSKGKFREIELMKDEHDRLEEECYIERQRSAELQAKITALTNKIETLKTLNNKEEHRFAQLEEEVATKDVAYIQALSHAEGLQNVLTETERQLSINITSKDEENVSQLRMEITARDGRILELEEQIGKIEERYQQTVSAAEAKIQEKEIVIESLEQELVKSGTKVQSLENSLSEVEERRKSLEGKAEVLGERLQESDRKTEEVVENEGMLEHKLALLLETETHLKHKLEEMKENNEELEEKMRVMSDVNKELHKNLTNLESSSKGLQREIERLSEIESAFNEESAKVEVLNTELRHIAQENERRIKDKVDEVKMYSYSLESDLKSAHEKLEVAETERKELSENVEYLNSRLIQVEEKISAYSEEWESKLLEKENEITQLQEEKKKLRIQFEDKITLLKSELEKSNQTETKPKETEVENQTLDLSVKVAQLNDLLGQKEKEIKNYQTRLLQLQFGGKVQAPTEKIQDDVNLKKISELETINHELEVTLSTIKEQLSNSLNELEAVKTQVKTYKDEVTSLQETIETLQKETNIKNEEQLLKSFSETDIQERLDSLRKDYEYKLLALEQEKTELYREMLREKVRPEIENIVTLAKQRIQNMNNDIIETIDVEKTPVKRKQKKVSFDESTYNWDEPVTKWENQVVNSEQHRFSYSNFQEPSVQAIKFDDMFVNKQNTEQTINMYMDTVSYPLHAAPSLEDFQKQINQLEEKLSVIKAERDEAISQLKQLSLKIQESHQQELSAEGPIPVVEEVCSKTSSYLTYQPNELQPVQEEILVPTIDSVNLQGQEHSQLKTFTFFQDGDHSQDFIQITPQESSWNEGAASEDDGWGWGSDEARLEEEHLQLKQQQSVEKEVPLSNEDSNGKLSQLETQIKLLVFEKEVLAEDVKASQVRCGKLLKKLKDLKIKNDNLLKENLELTQKSSGMGFGDLDSAIEEELKIRIDSLEKELKEVKTECDSTKQEREGLLKRIDMLTSANERFVELKERQDIDVEICQRKNKEFCNRIQALEWKIEELREEKASEDPKTGEGPWETVKTDASTETKVQENLGKVQELQEQLSALALDNEQLQNLLEQQRDMRLTAEAAMAVLQAQLASSVDSTQTLNSDNQLQIASLVEENSKLKEICRFLQQQVEDLHSAQGNFQHLLNDKESLALENSRLTGELNNLQNVYYALKTEYECIQAQFEEKMSMIARDNEGFHNLKNDYEERIELLGKEKAELEGRYNEVMKEHYTLTDEYRRVSVEVQELNEKCARLTTENQSLSETIATKESEVLSLVHLKDELQSNCEQRNHELESKYEQEIERLRKEQTHVQESVLYVPTNEPIVQVSETFKTFTMSGPSDELTDFHSGINSRDEDVLKLQSEVQRKTAEIESLLQTIESLKFEKEELEQDFKAAIKRLSDELDSANCSISTEREHHKEALGRLQEELQQRDVQLNNLQEQIMNMSSIKNESLSSLEEQIHELKIQLENKDKDILWYLQNNDEQSRKESQLMGLLNLKEQEIETIKLEVSGKERELIEALGMREQDIENLKIQMMEREREVEETNTVKDEDIQNLQIQLQERNRMLDESLGTKEEDIHNLRLQVSEKDKKIYELSRTLEEEAQQLTELRKLLGEREFEIRELKNELQAKEAEHSRLRSQFIASEGGDIKTDIDRGDEESQQNELDLALYMLHQRDVRCDELTLELMQLLEERDTLQLRLSNALRVNEEIRSLTKQTSSSSSSPVRIVEATSEDRLPTSSMTPLDLSIEDRPDGHTAVEGTRENLQELADKLSQLHRVGYRRDVTLRDEQEQRHMAQMKLLNPRGAGIVMDANYTV